MAVGKRVPGQIVVGVEYVADVSLFDRPEERRDSSHKEGDSSRKPVDSSHKDGDSSHKKTLPHIELSETVLVLANSERASAGKPPRRHFRPRKWT